MTIPKRAPKPVSPVMRAQLADALVEHIEALELTQSEAAEILGIAQSRLNLILRGHGASFSTDMLANLATRLGLKVRLSVTRGYKKS